MQWFATYTIWKCINATYHTKFSSYASCSGHKCCPAKKVITQHGYLTGLTVAQILDIDDTVFSLWSSPVQCITSVDQASLCTSSSKLTASLTLFQRVSNALLLQNTVQKQMLERKRSNYNLKKYQNKKHTKFLSNGSLSGCICCPCQKGYYATWLPFWAYNGSNPRHRW